MVEAALALNKVTGINQVIIGATFVSVATTLPEVFVSMFAVLSENHSIAVGNAVGSMICNIALVFALYITFMPHKVSRREVFNKSICLLVVTLIFFLFALNLRISWIESAVLLCAFVGFIYMNVRESREKEALDPTVIERCLSSGTEDEKCKKIATRKIVLGFAAGQAMLIIGAFLLVRYAERLAMMFGISATVIGLTVIAIGTSMPELITCITSIRKKSGGLALGNALGANVINCTLLLGTCGLIGDIKGNYLPISRETVFISIPFLFILYIISILPMLYRGRTFRWQGITLLVLYAVYILYLVAVQPI